MRMALNCKRLVYSSYALRTSVNGCKYLKVVIRTLWWIDMLNYLFERMYTPPRGARPPPGVNCPPA